MSTWRNVAMALAVSATSACTASQGPRQVRAVYDVYSRRLMVLATDQNGDGALDQWTYLDGNRPLRGEADSNGDGRIDRWEYFDESSALVKVGTSSQGDGVEDTWAWVVPVDGQMRVDHSLSRDRQANRREFFQGTALMRAEEDTNGDGRIDRWDTYVGGVLTRAEFDTTFTRPTPNRRLVYDAAGRFQRLEMESRGDGTFVAAAVQPPASTARKR